MKMFPNYDEDALSKLFDSLSEGEIEDLGNEIIVYDKTYEKANSMGVQLELNIELYDRRCFLCLKHIESKTTIFDVWLDHVDEVYCKGNRLIIGRSDSKDRIEVELEPHFSLKISNMEAMP